MDEERVTPVRREITRTAIEAKDAHNGVATSDGSH